MKTSWTEHRSNQEVLDMVDENRSLNTIRQRQKNWLGHVLRSESLLCTVLGRMERTRTRGRQSATMIDWMKSNDVEYKHTEKTGIIGGLDLPEKAEHSRKNLEWVLLIHLSSHRCHHHSQHPFTLSLQAQNLPFQQVLPSMLLVHQGPDFRKILRYS